MPIPHHVSRRPPGGARADLTPAPGPASTRRRALRGIAILVAVVFASGCGSDGPASPSASGPATAVPSPTAGPETAGPSPVATASPSAAPSAAAVYRAIEDWVAADRQLQAITRTDPVVLGEADLRKRVQDQFTAENPPARVEAGEIELRAMGLLGAGDSLATLYTDLLGSQVLGFYDPDTKQLYVVARTGEIGPLEKFTTAHEFTHALQDQHFDIKGLGLDTIGTGDRSLARLALVEGDASLESYRWLPENLTSDELGQFLRESTDAAAAGDLEKVPAILRDTLTFPYEQGYFFVNERFLTGGWEAVDELYGRPPDSTEQILHPEKYVAEEQPAAVKVDGAALAAGLGAGWSAADEDTLGEFQLTVWLRERTPASATEPSAADAAAGWGGDRFALLRGPGGAYAMVIRTRWDTAADATEFEAAAGAIEPALPGAHRIARPVAGGDEVDVTLASDSAILARLGR